MLRQMQRVQSLCNPRSNLKSIHVKVKADNRRASEKLCLKSYLDVCIDGGHIKQATSLLETSYHPRRFQPVPDVEHYNIILRGWARLFSVPRIAETRLLMIKNNIEPNAESYAYVLLSYTKQTNLKKNSIRRLIEEMKSNNVDYHKLCHSTYLNSDHRTAIGNLIRKFDPKYEEIFSSEPLGYNCKLMDSLAKVDHKPNYVMSLPDLTKLNLWADRQRSIEWAPSLSVSSVAKPFGSKLDLEKYSNHWQKLQEIWKKAICKCLSDSLEALKNDFLSAKKVHLYPYLCAIDKSVMLKLILNEIETTASFSSYSMSTSVLHSNLGTKIMTRYFRDRDLADGSHKEKQQIYDAYLKEYCSSPSMIGRISSRQYIQEKALSTKNYSVYKDKLSPTILWPNYIVSAVGRFLYGIMLREVKFDPEIVKNPDKELNSENLTHAFYTAYFPVNATHKIKEEFRAHQEFEKLIKKCSYETLKFDYSNLPSSSPPLPWLSPGFGGYLTAKSDLVRFSNYTGDIQSFNLSNTVNQKLYPSLDSLNTLGLCPWVVNTEILDIVIELFKSGGNTDLGVPLDESIMKLNAPKLEAGASKTSKILYNKQKRVYEQKKKEMYSLWRDCLNRLSIANHFRDQIFWLPHNMDFRGRTYPIPPHFNHLGADLARSLLLFATGKPLGEKGLDWIKLHLINLVGNMKSCPLHERLKYANSILHSEVLDSADNPWDGKKWWMENENPWQVLACCKEIAEAVRSKDFRQYVSHFPVHQDGSCNGLQHYAALGRDPEGAKAVNLVPNDRPQDVYSRVVDIVEEMRRTDARNGLHEAIVLEGLVKRKVIKQTVMTIVYGVTRYGARLQIARQLNSKDLPEKDVWLCAMYLVSKTFDSIGKMFNNSRAIQTWFNQCAIIIASRYKQPISWETPTGFLVTQPYKQPKLISSKRSLSSSIWKDKPRFLNPAAQLNTSKQRTAFPPNYIHSLDSTHMMLTSIFCQRIGLAFVSVHDCFWTHPSTVDLMNQICREQFVAMHSEPLLENLSEQFIQKFLESNNSSSLEESNDVSKESKTSKKKKLETPSKFLCATSKKYVSPSTKIAKLDSSNLYIDNSDYYSSLVDRDLELLIEEDIDKDREHEAETNEFSEDVSTLHSMYSNERESALLKIKATFEKIPAKGTLDLSVVLKSTYFFS